MALIELLLKGVAARVLIFGGLPRRAHDVLCWFWKAPTVCQKHKELEFKIHAFGMSGMGLISLVNMRAWRPSPFTRTS